MFQASIDNYLSRFGCMLGCDRNSLFLWLSAWLLQEFSVLINMHLPSLILQQETRGNNIIIGK